MRFRFKISFLFLVTGALTFFSDRFVDREISLYVQRSLMSDSLWGRHTARLPDALLLFVVVTETAAVSMYRYLDRRDRLPSCRFALLDIAYAVPAGYLLKSLLKFVFGRVTTRGWLAQPGLYGFHWFASDARFTGFPSGHMVVFTTLAAALWRLHPRYRPFYAGFTAVLAAALIGSNYHFFSDVLAGFFLGITVEAGVFHYLIRNRSAAQFVAFPIEKRCQKRG